MTTGLAAVLTSIVDELESLLDVGRTPMWPPYYKPDPNWTLDQNLSDSLARAATSLRQKPVPTAPQPDLQHDPLAFSNISLVAVNLKDQSAPTWGGYRETAETSIFSTAKIAAMFAAFQLRSDAAFLAQTVSDVNDPTQMPQRVTQLLLSKWNDKGNPPWVQAIAGSPPNLSAIFDFEKQNDGWHVNFAATPAFAGMSKRQVFDSLTSIHAKTSDTDIHSLGFQDLQRLMIGWSDNVAASLCIRAIGYVFMDALLRQTRLFDSQSGSGLRLTSDYDGGTWDGHDVNGITQAGNALSLAKFFTLLAQGRLVNPSTACDEMKDLMRKANPVGTDALLGGWRWEKCFFAEDLENSAPSSVSAFSKIGIGNVQTDGKGVLQQEEECEAALITHGSFTYVAVGLRAIAHIVDHQPDGSPIYIRPFEILRQKIENCLGSP